jgi:hypothetical protein
MGEPTREQVKEEIARMYDVPPWLTNPDRPRPRFARARWALRRVWPKLVWRHDDLRRTEHGDD